MKLSKDEIDTVAELAEIAYSEGLLNENAAHLLKLIWEYCPDIQEQQTWIRI